MTGLESRRSESSREDAAPFEKTRTDETFSILGNLGNSFIFGDENVPSVGTPLSLKRVLNLNTIPLSCKNVEVMRTTTSTGYY